MLYENNSNQFIILKNRTNVLTSVNTLQITS